MSALTDRILTCLRCGHQWIPNLPKKDVRICPNCKSARWNEPPRPRHGTVSAAPC